MKHYTIGCDAHKHYSVFAVMDAEGQVVKHQRVEHQPGALQAFLKGYPGGTPVAVESVGNWYWIVEEIEAAGCRALLTHAGKAKLMMGNINKTDKLDAQGLALLLHLGSLPEVWVPPGERRDARQLPRTRMALVRMRTRLKNRMHATLAKYNRKLEGASDIFIPKWREDLQAAIQSLPAETARCLSQELDLLDELVTQIKQLEKRMLAKLEHSPEQQWLGSLPGVGAILAVIIENEIGNMARFASAERFASYAGLTPTVQASGGRVRYGHMPKAANPYLKWAFIEAANAIVRHQRHPRWQHKHVVRRYRRLRARKGHAVAVGAVARHLAEAAFWMLTKQEDYREPAHNKVLPTQGQARTPTAA
jgi:transposase